MNIVITMAGEGRRFIEAGFTGPKMLIDIAGRPMFHWALDSLLPHFPEDRFIFVCLEEHMYRTKLAERIWEICPRGKIYLVPNPTNGQAASAVAAKEHLDLKKPLLIYNCDTYTACPISQAITSHQGEGIVVAFNSTDPCYSYVDLDSKGFVREVREKTVISPWATAGMYYFTSTEKFVHLVEEAMTGPLPSEGEWYVAPLYNRVIEAGGQVEVVIARQCLPFGTPSQLEKFENAIRSGEVL